MPLYEYQCDACGKRFEAIQKFSDPVLEICRLCAQGPVQRLLSSPAIQFKGSGWYITDYSQKGKAPAQNGGEKSGDKSSADAKSDATKSDSAATPAAKSDSKSDATTSSSTSASTKSDSSQ